MRLRGFLSLVTSACGFGLGVVLGKQLTETLDGALIATIGLSGGGLLLAGYLLLRRRALLPRLSLGGWLSLLALAIFGTAIPLLLVLAGFTRISAIASGVLLQAQGPAAVLFAVLWLRERLAWWQVVGSGILVAGSVLVVWRPGLTWEGDAVGALLVLVGALGYGFALIPAKRLAARADPLQVGALRLLLAAIVIAPLPFVHVQWPLDVQLQVPLIGEDFSWLLIGTLALYIFVSNCVSYIAQQSGLRSLKAWEAATILQTIPLFTVLFAIILLSEAPTPLQIAGGAAVILGGIIAGRGAPAPKEVVSVPR